MPKKTFAQPFRTHSSDPAEDLIDSREENQVDDRKVIIAAARAAAVVELEVSFWDHLTCNAMDH